MKRVFNSKDIKINQNEFSYIIDHKSDQRLSKLEYFRDNLDLFKNQMRKTYQYQKHRQKGITP